MHKSNCRGASARPRHRRVHTQVGDILENQAAPAAAIAKKQQKLKDLEDKYSFLVGDAPIFADLGLFYVLYELAEEDNVPDFDRRFELPRLGAFVRDMASRPHLADYLASPRRMPRYERDRSGASLYTYVAGRRSPAVIAPAETALAMASACASRVAACEKLLGRSPGGDAGAAQAKPLGLPRTGGAGFLARLLAA